MIRHTLLLMEKDFRQLIRDRGFIIFVGIWALVAATSHFAPHLPSPKFPETEATTTEKQPFNSSNDADINTDTKINVGIIGNCPVVENLLKSNGRNLSFSALTEVSPDQALAKHLVDIVIAFPSSMVNLSMDASNIVPPSSSGVSAVSNWASEQQKRSKKRSGNFGLKPLPPEVQVIYTEVSSDTINAITRVTNALTKAKNTIVEHRLAQLGLQEQWWQTFQIRNHVKSSYGAEDLSLPVVMPFLLTFAVSFITTVFSIELICRESIRGTLALLIATPIRRISILASKTMIVCWSAFCSLGAAMTIVEGPLKSQKIAMPIDNFSAVLLMSIPLIFTIAGWSAFMALRIRTRGTAMARLIPGSIIIIVLAGISTLPGVHSTADVTLVPIANITSLIKDWLSGNWNPVIALSTCIVALFYGMVCMQQAALMLDEHGDISVNSNIPGATAGNMFQLSVVLGVIAILTNFYISRMVLIVNAPIGWITATILTATLALLAALKIRRSVSLGLMTFTHSVVKKSLIAALASPVLLWVADKYDWLHILNPHLALTMPNGANPDLLRTVALVACTFVLPLSQEVLFRSVFQRTMSRVFKPLLLPAVVSIVYCLSQPDANDAGAYIGFGIILSLIAQKTGSVYPGIALRLCAAMLAVGWKLH